MSIEDNKTRNRILLVLFVGVLMGALDIAIVGPALPAMQSTFQVDDRAIAWIFSIYVLMNLIGTPLIAKLSDAFGRRNIYILSVSLFALGSLVVAASPALWVVLLGRAIQGLGAGGIFPVASAVIGDTFPPEKRGGALGLIGAVFGIAFLIGPIIGGVLLIFSWHWLFIINIPIAAGIIIAAARTLPGAKPADHKPFDLAGMSILAVLLGAFAFGLNMINTADLMGSITSATVWPFLLLAAIAAPIFWLQERRAPDPVLRVELLKSRQLALATLFALGAGLGETSLVFIPKLLKATFGVSESTASFMLLPVVLTMAVGSPVAGKMLDKYGSRVVVLAGTTLLSAGMIAVSIFTGNLPLFYVAAALVGFGLSALLGAPLRYIVLGETTSADRASAQGALSLATSVGQLAGGTLVGAILASQVGTDGFKSAYLMIGVVAAVLAVLAFALKSRKEESRSLEQQKVQVGKAA